MDPQEQSKLIQKLDSLGIDQVEINLTQKIYGERKKEFVEKWVRTKKQELDAPTYVYHPKQAPEGKIFKAAEATKLYREGWYDTPAKFPDTGLREVIVNFAKKEWKWIIGTSLVVIGLLIASQSS